MEHVLASLRLHSFIAGISSVDITAIVDLSGDSFIDSICRFDSGHELKSYTETKSEVVRSHM